MNTLPETGYFNTPNNLVSQMFTGRILIENAGALLFFEKESKYNKLLYELKYRGNVQSGMFLGKLIGSRLREAAKKFDCIVPVPLHKRKYRKRGFNQSEIIAQGISIITNTPMLGCALQRRVYNPTQTKKGRYDRWQNVEGIFQCTQPYLLANKHILLVDDVITTGATLEAAGNELLKINNTKISIATVAYANL